MSALLRGVNPDARLWETALGLWWDEHREPSSTQGSPLLLHFWVACLGATCRDITTGEDTPSIALFLGDLQILLAP